MPSGGAAARSRQLATLRHIAHTKFIGPTIGLYSTIHEMGYALYEQGVTLEFEATPLAGGASAGVHESQSRL